MTEATPLHQIALTSRYVWNRATNHLETLQRNDYDEIKSRTRNNPNWQVLIIETRHKTDSEFNTTKKTYHIRMVDDGRHTNGKAFQVQHTTWINWFLAALHIRGHLSRCLQGQLTHTYNRVQGSN
ncbi:hypothetical protein D5R81_03195 [Parashewanella spongiae]|uniref:Uncharacterized protein n=1 Tax=Parashewanella spongiae TaxID=342950 RepID=A0A3A6UBB1_9GAMM|nr:hypothetical protein [Parashewanella spongiae]MCL1077839.1 hypothetical protein [Parashewanella spongiae]RJY18864.1 hypothetical protein D5R81_03195 [Parashewanella spongiae]